MWPGKKQRAWYWYALGALVMAVVMYLIAGLFQSLVSRRSGYKPPEDDRWRSTRVRGLERFLRR